MNCKTTTTNRSLLFLLIVSFCAVAVAGEYEVSWYTFGVGGTVSAGGSLELTGTVGQPDAGVMSGGNYDLTGGFWAVPPCWCMSDVNNDGLRDGEDIQDFVDCLFATGSNCACADLVTDGSLDLNDVTIFVNGLLSGQSCQ